MARGTTERKNYLNCSRGKWRERVDQSVAGATPRTITPKEGQPYIVHEIVSDFASGLITKIETQVHEQYGRKLLVTIVDGEETLVLQMQYDSSYAMSFLSKLPNADIKQHVSFYPYYFPEDKKARLVLKQGELSIPNYFTREDPKGFPKFPVIEGNPDAKDEIKIWSIMAMKFLAQYAAENIMPNLASTEQQLEDASIRHPKREDELRDGNDAGFPSPDEIPGTTGRNKDLVPPDEMPEDDLPF